MLYALLTVKKPIVRKEELYATVVIDSINPLELFLSGMLKINNTLLNKYNKAEVFITPIL